MLRFIHAADIHLDSPLRGLSAYQGAPVDTLRGATRVAFVNLIDEAIEHEVDFVLLAGDLYDGDWPDYNTGLFFAQQIGRLKHRSIPVIMILGNHDAASVITKQLAWPENVRILSHRKPETYRLEDLRVAIHGQSFPQRDVSENMVANYPAPVPDYFNIGMLHTALAGRPPHAPYAPCSVDELVARGYDYWALGHVHAYEIVHQNPYIVFPGNLQGRHIRETGSHGAVLVTVDDDIHVERMILDVLRWQIVEVDVTGTADLVGVATACGEALRAPLDATDNLPLAVRVRLTGATRLHGLLTDAGGRLREEVLAQAVALDEQRVWIEKVVTATTPATIADSAIADDTLAELRTAMEQAVNDAGFFEALRRDVDEILSKVPMPVLQEQGCGLSRFKGDSLITAVRAEIPGLIARLSQAAGA